MVKYIPVQCAGPFKRVFIIKRHMEKKRAQFASTEELIADLSNWEDPDSQLLVSVTEEGGVFIQDFEGRDHGIGQTMKEALLDFGRNIEFNYWEEMDLDWSDVIDKRTEN